ncbi:MAG: Ig-like domain-containing protein, partial [Bacteroidota bacterium]|nr:Ig-like domain-containing protein [Bacteroidota bacterium]
MFNSFDVVRKFSCIAIVLIVGLACKKKETDTPPPDALHLVTVQVDNKPSAAVYYDIKINPVLKLAFNNAVDRQTVAANVSLNESNVTSVPVNYSYEKNDSVIVIVPQLPLKYLTRYFLRTTTGLQSAKKGSLGTAINIEFITSIDSSDKFPLLTDNQLLDTVQRRTFRFFWEFGHPISGMARERNSSGDLVTTGGTGFGIMSIISAVNRNFITRTEGRDRILKITNFLLNNCTRYHGAFAHWVNGASGATIPFSSNDNGADLVETSYLINGLLTARQYFNGADGVETDLRSKINTIWNGVEWNWFRQNNQNVLYWHWSPTLNWVINLPVRGWNEALIVYILASSSLTDSIPKVVYDNGWAGNGAIRNNNTYYGYQ